MYSYDDLKEAQFTLAKIIQNGHYHVLPMFERVTAKIEEMEGNSLKKALEIAAKKPF